MPDPDLSEKLVYLRDFVIKARRTPLTQDLATLAISCMDLTSLTGHETTDDIDNLCAKADQGNGLRVAAVCVYPQHIARAVEKLQGKNIAVATVINFPSGESTSIKTMVDTSAANAAGAVEQDIVLAYQSFHEGKIEIADDLLKNFMRLCREDQKDKTRSKVILESSAFYDMDQLYDAALLALKHKPDFLKTSTGKHPNGGATLEAVAVMLAAIRDTQSETGLKVSGGVTSDNAAQYIALARDMMGENWVTTERFRIGASSALDGLLAAARPGTTTPPPAPPQPY